MSSDPIYLLDANVFIEAAHRYYAFDIAPAFWDNLVAHASNGRIQSIDRIKRQLEVGKDDLARWIKDGNLGDAFADTGNADVIQSFSALMAWVQANAQFMDAAKARFANDPDGWLVAFARVKGYIVVTHETPRPEARSRVPIPNVCLAFGVRFMDTFEMLRALGVKFSS
jgi:predicted nucleic acid-binding protein